MHIRKIILIGCIWLVCCMPSRAIDTNQMMKDRFSIEDEWTECNIEVTFYTSLTCENGPLGGMDAQDQPLRYSTIAVPREIPLGTEFEIEGFKDTFVARDRGSVKHIIFLKDGTMRVDMFIPRNAGENDTEYWERVNALGRVQTTGRYKEC